MCGNPTFEPLVAAEAEQLLWRTIRYWGAWSAKCTYERPYREAVVRSASPFNIEAPHLYPDLRMRFLLASIREQR